MLVAIGSLKGSPGATTLALALAARWPEPGTVVVEASPAGGDLAARFGCHRSPGLAEMAADSRSSSPGQRRNRGPDREAINPYVQRLGEIDVDVVLGPAEPQMESAIGLLAGTGVLQSLARDRTVLCDVGRLDRTSPALPLACASDVLLIVSTGWPESVDALQVRREQLLALPGLRAKVGLVLVGDLPYSPREVAAAVGLPVMATVPHDRAGAAVLAGRARAGRTWTRLPLLREARSFARSLSAAQAAPAATAAKAAPQTVDTSTAEAPQPTKQPRMMLHSVQDEEPVGGSDVPDWTQIKPLPASRSRSGWAPTHPGAAS